MSNSVNIRDAANVGGTLTAQNAAVLGTVTTPFLVIESNAIIPALAATTITATHAALATLTTTDGANIGGALDVSRGPTTLKSLVVASNAQLQGSNTLDSLLVLKNTQLSNALLVQGPTNAAGGLTTTALTITDLDVVMGGRLVVQGVSLTIAAGSVTAVVGRSGAGKSVLWKSVAGLIPRSRGAVIVSVPPLVFVHQDPALLDDRSVHDNLLLFALAADADDRARDVARSLGISHLLRVPAAALSPAQARRVALARALVLRPGILVVDEPTTGLDVVAAAEVDRALVDSVASGSGALVVITHHPRTLAALQAIPGCRTLLVQDGSVSEQWNAP
jgi:ABC-type nitrate/sulfonate/bicarbonate transport system ATPase subunit